MQLLLWLQLSALLLNKDTATFSIRCMTAARYYWVKKDSRATVRI